MKKTHDSLLKRWGRYCCWSLCTFRGLALMMLAVLVVGGGIFWFWEYKRPFRVLVGIMSAPSASDRRDAVRKSWLSQFPPECVRVAQRGGKLRGVGDCLAIVEYRFLSEGGGMGEEDEKDILFGPHGELGGNLWGGSESAEEIEDAKVLERRGLGNSLAFKFGYFLWWSDAARYDFSIRVDDDGFLCLQRLIGELALRRVGGEWLQWGLFHGPPNPVRVDENFIVFGQGCSKILASAVSVAAEQWEKYQDPKALENAKLGWFRSASILSKNNKNNNVPILRGGFFGGTALHRWLAAIETLDFHDGRIWNDQTTLQIHGFCNHYIYCHKCGASTRDQIPSQLIALSQANPYLPDASYLLPSGSTIPYSKSFLPTTATLIPPLPMYDTSLFRSTLQTYSINVPIPLSFGLLTIDICSYITKIPTSQDCLQDPSYRPKWIEFLNAIQYTNPSLTSAYLSKHTAYLESNNLQSTSILPSLLSQPIPPSPKQPPLFITPQILTPLAASLASAPPPNNPSIAARSIPKLQEDIEKRY